MAGRNTLMITRLGEAPVRYPFRFIIAGDTAASPNPTGDAIFTQLLRQMEQLDPKPLFFANLGDFSGPGTPERHAHYLELVSKLTVPNICVMGNHEMDHPAGWDAFQHFHGPQNFEFAYGHTRFVVLNCQPGTHGPRAEDLVYLDEVLKRDDHLVRVVLMHMPPNLNHHYAPHAEWGFTHYAQEFYALLKAYQVRLVCCAHVLAYDYYLHEGVSYVVSGGGGWGLCSHFGICHGSQPPTRGSFYHFVDITIEAAGVISGRVIRAFDGVQADPAYNFTA
jgi:hypothetical protein